MSSKVGMEDFTATRPSAVIVLDLESEVDVLARVSGRRVDMATGKVLCMFFQHFPAAVCFVFAITVVVVIVIVIVGGVGFGVGRGGSGGGASFDFKIPPSSAVVIVSVSL